MRVLCIEPFCGGSHGAFVRTLQEGLERRFDVVFTTLSMPARHWKWRMRGAVPWLRQEHDAELRDRYDLVFASSFLALAELVGLYPHLAAVPRVLYFHENQLAYPARASASTGAGAGAGAVAAADEPGQRDHHYGFTQMVSALAATRCVFNSEFNLRSFLDAGDALLRRMPDAVPDGWAAEVEARSEVLGLPLDLPVVEAGRLGEDPLVDRTRGPLLLWNHRWEHDKNPEEFFAVLGRLHDDGVPFRLAVCGETFREVPDAMTRGRAQLADRIEHFGFLPSREEYWALLGRSQLAVSTAVHEFFGMSALEATWMGARPLLPDRLAYPELFPTEYLYRDLESELRTFCTEWSAKRMGLRCDRQDLVRRHHADHVLPRYHELLCGLLTRG